jgi:hypothetical protein
LKNDIKKTENDVILDKIYDFSMRSSADCSVSFLNRLEIALYIIFSSRYAARYLRLEAVREILRTDFLPPVSDFGDCIEDSIMERINEDTVEMLYEEQNPAYEVSFRGWVITGLVVLISLTVSFFGMDSVRMIPDDASSFLLPIGITIGVIVTVYGALFIGSHLKELMDRFGLH